MVGALPGISMPADKNYGSGSSHSNSSASVMRLVINSDCCAGSSTLVDGTL